MGTILLHKVNRLKLKGHCYYKLNIQNVWTNSFWVVHVHCNIVYLLDWNKTYFKERFKEVKEVELWLFITKIKYANWFGIFLKWSNHLTSRWRWLCFFFLFRIYFVFRRYWSNYFLLSSAWPEYLFSTNWGSENMF